MKNLKRLWIEQQVRMKLKAEGLDPLYEYYNTGDDFEDFGYGDGWLAQTFTVGGTGHTITSVKLKLYRYGSPGIVMVSIRATDVEGKPTGADLTSGTTNGNTLPTGAPYEWRGIALTEIELSPNTKYAIVCKPAPNGNGSNLVYWREHFYGLYVDGRALSNDWKPGYWRLLGPVDFMFEVWGNPLAPPPEYVLGIGVDKDAAYMGETFTFSGGLLQDGIPVPGILVTLFKEGIEVGSATTDEEGTWVIPWVSNVSGTLSFHAEALVEGAASISSRKLLMSVAR